MWRFSKTAYIRNSKFYITAIAALLFFCSSSCVYAQAKYARDKIKYITSISGYGEKINFKRPVDIFVDHFGDIYIADLYKNAVFILNKDFLPVAVIDKVNGLSSRPLSVAVSEEGMIYVVEEGVGNEPARLLSFNLRGEFKKQIKLKGFEGSETFTPIDLTVDKTGNLYLAGGSSGLVILDKSYNFLINIQPVEIIKEKKERSFINEVALGKGGLIYLLSRSAPRIYVYDAEGNFISKFGKLGGTTGALSTPKGIAVDSRTDIVYVMDYMRHTLLAYKTGENSNGEYHEKFFFEYGGLGSGTGWFQFPTGICLSEDGRLFVADTFNHRVQVFDTKD